jgi:hypothetical protein
MEELDRVVDVLYQMIMGIEPDRRYTMFTFSSAGVDAIRRAIAYFVVVHEISYDDALVTMERFHEILYEERRKEREAWLKEK